MKYKMKRLRTKIENAIEHVGLILLYFGRAIKHLCLALWYALRGKW